MKSKPIKTAAILLLLLLSGCGGSRKLIENATPLGWVPFSSSDLAPPAEDWDRTMLRELENSGGFLMVPVDTLPAFPDLARLQNLADSSFAWIVTGRLISENTLVKPGWRIPFLFYSPVTIHRLKLEFRLFNTAKNNWEAVEELTVEEGEKGDWQLLDYDPADPSLQPDAVELALLRQKVYEKAALKLTDLLLENIN
ncbi:MAG: hypothetical protein WAN36_12215 [Calditrichia bacterium]